MRRDTGETWRQYIRRLATEDGVAAQTDEDARRLDRRRKKRVSDADWQSGSDPESRITKMKDGRTHLAYKAEHVIDLESEVIVAAQIYPGDAGDAVTLNASVQQAEAYGDQLAVPLVIEDVVGDKGYHAAATMGPVQRSACGPTSPERDCDRRRWHDKPVAWSSRYATIGGACATRRVGGSNGCDRSGANGASRTPAKREPTAHVAARPRERRKALHADGRRAQSWAPHCGISSGSARRGACRGSPGDSRRLCMSSSRSRGRSYLPGCVGHHRGSRTRLHCRQRRPACGKNVGLLQRANSSGRDTRASATARRVVVRG